MSLTLAGLAARRPFGVRAIDPGPPPELVDTGGLNAASALNDALLWAVVSGAHPRRDRVGGTDGQAEGGADLGTDASGFSALRSPSWGGAGWYWPAPTIAGLEWTVGVRLRLESPGEGEQPAGDQAKILAIPFHEQPAWFPPGGWHMWLGPMDDGATVGQLRVGYAINSSTLRACQGPSDLVLLDGAEHTYVARVRDEGTNGAIDWWRDGTLAGTTSFNAAHVAPDLGAAPYLIAFERHRVEGGEGCKGRLSAAAIWGKALSDAQIALFSSDPWDLADVSDGPAVAPALHAWDDYVTADAGEITPLAVLLNDSGAGLSVTDVTQPQSVAAGTSAAVASGGGVEVTIDPDETAEAFEFTYTAEDADQNQDTATVHVRVVAPPPLGVDDGYSLQADDTHVVSPLDNDNAPEGSIIVQVTQPQGVEAGTSVAIAANGIDLEITIDAAETGSFEFTYTGEAPDETQWTNGVAVAVQTGSEPEPGENEALPFFGRFYGNVCNTANTGVANSTFNRRWISFFFWADRTAVIDGIQWHIRYDAPNYSNGTGGTYTVRIVEADPSTKRAKWPLVTVCSISNYKPAERTGINPATQAGWTYDEFTFSQTGQVQAKKAYCLLFENTDAPGSNYVSINIDFIASYFNNEGTVSYAKEEEFWSPARVHFPDSSIRAWMPWTVVARGNDSTPATIPLQNRRHGPPIATLRYADGIYSGWSISLSGSTDLYSFEISGSNQIRDRFRVTLASRVIDRLYIWPFRQRGVSASGNLIVTLEQGPASDTSGNGTVLEEWTVPVSSIHQLLHSSSKTPRANESSSGVDDIDYVPFIELLLPAPRTLQLGQLYNVRMRSTGSVVLQRIRISTEREGMSPEASSWDEYEQIRKVSWLAGWDSRGWWRTTNGGSSWTFSSTRRWGWLARCVVG